MAQTIEELRSAAAAMSEADVAKLQQAGPSRI